jgi:hypothetical protein
MRYINEAVKVQHLAIARNETYTEILDNNVISLDSGRTLVDACRYSFDMHSLYEVCIYKIDADAESTVFNASNLDEFEKFDRYTMIEHHLFEVSKDAQNKIFEMITAQEMFE